jgi:hypothetical protein
VNSYLTEDFLVSYRLLPAQIRNQARKAYRLWKQNPHHPGLRFKRVHTTEPLYAVRVGRGWRVLGLREGEAIYWFRQQLKAGVWLRKFIREGRAAGPCRAPPLTEHGVPVAHSTMHGWVTKHSPQLEKAFHHRKRPSRIPQLALPAPAPLIAFPYAALLSALLRYTPQGGRAAPVLGCSGGCAAEALAQNAVSIASPLSAPHRLRCFAGAPRLAILHPPVDHARPLAQRGRRPPQSVTRRQSQSRQSDGDRHSSAGSRP